MAKISFDLNGTANPSLVEVIVQGDTVNSIKILAKDKKTVARIKKALGHSSLKRRSDLKIRRNHASKLVTALFIFLRMQFGHKVVAIRREIEAGKTYIASNPEIVWHTAD